MIATVTLNAAIDKTYWIPQFSTGAVNRTRSVTATPGGKGLNVSRVIRKLGEDVTATGFVGGYNGRFIVDQLDKLGIRHEFVRIDGESRICLNIIDHRNGKAVSTEILEEGPTVEQSDLAGMEETVDRLASVAKIITFSGSLPKGAPSDFYSKLLGICAGRGTVAYLDTSGTALRESLRAMPSFIKPNEDEIAQLIGKSEASFDDVVGGIRLLMSGGIRTVSVTLGAGGSLSGHEGKLYKVAVPPVQAVNTVGCGDAFVAGMSVAECRGEPIERRLAFAAAVASASAMTASTGEVNLEDVQALLSQIRVDELEH